MRPLALMLLLASCGLLHAQVQERKLVDRLLSPDKTLAYSLQGKEYYGGSTSSMDISKDANVKDYYFVQKFSPKAFDTKEYEAKDFWQGDFQFATKSATVKTDPDSGKTFGTKTMQVKDARESGKAFQTDKHTYATRAAPAIGKTSQNHLDEMYKGQPGQMNIDEVRDLLNKPKL